MITKRYTITACLLFTLCLAVSAMIPQAPPDVVRGKLVGVVLDPAKDIVAGATITIRGPRFRREVWSANDGTYSIELPPGTYNVRIAHPGFLPFRKRVQIKSNDVSKLDVIFRLNPRLFGKTWIVTKRG